MLGWSATANLGLSGQVLCESSDARSPPPHPDLQQFPGCAGGGGCPGGARHGASGEVPGGLQPASPCVPSHPSCGEGGGGDAGACQVAPWGAPGGLLLTPGGGPPGLWVRM